MLRRGQSGSIEPHRRVPQRALRPERACRTLRWPPAGSRPRRRFGDRRSPFHPFLGSGLAGGRRSVAHRFVANCGSVRTGLHGADLRSDLRQPVHRRRPLCQRCRSHRLRLRTLPPLRGHTLLYKRFPSGVGSSSAIISGIRAPSTASRFTTVSPISTATATTATAAAILLQSGSKTLRRRAAAAKSRSSASQPPAGNGSSACCNDRRNISIHRSSRSIPFRFISSLHVL